MSSADFFLAIAKVLLVTVLGPAIALALLAVSNFLTRVHEARNVFLSRGGKQNGQ
jgi:hypothetical protein